MPENLEKEILRTDQAKGLELGEDSVDRVTATIGGATIMNIGVVKDKRFEIDAQTLSQVVSMGNAATRGVKMRFGHPSMSDDALGTFLGRVKDFRFAPGEDHVLGNLFFDSTAFHTPSGDLAGYVLGRAKSDPDSFGMSVVVDGKRAQRVNKDGTPVTAEDGSPLPPLLRLNAFLGADVVDSPAATNGLFGLNFQTQISAEVLQGLEELMRRPDFVKRAYVFFGRAMNEIGPLATGGKITVVNKTGLSIETEESEEDSKKTVTLTLNKESAMADDSMTLEQLETKHAELVQKIQDKATGEATKTERERVTEITAFANTMPCDVKKELLEAVKDGHSYFQAVATFKQVEIDTRDKTAKQPTGLKEDSQVGQTQTFATYEEAWSTIKFNEHCDTVDAMRRAQDRYPKLYESFLARQPRNKI